METSAQQPFMGNAIVVRATVSATVYPLCNQFAEECYEYAIRRTTEEMLASSDHRLGPHDKGMFGLHIPRVCLGSPGATGSIDTVPIV